jgi:hypothetical protein
VISTKIFAALRCDVANFDSLIVVIAGSNPAEGIDVHLLFLFCFEQLAAFGTG